MPTTVPRAAPHPGSLFAAETTTAEIEGGIADLIAEYLRANDVAAPADPNALAARFATGEVPAGSLRLDLAAFR